MPKINDLDITHVLGLNTLMSLLTLSAQRVEAPCIVTKIPKNFRVVVPKLIFYFYKAMFCTKFFSVDTEGSPPPFPVSLELV